MFIHPKYYLQLIYRQQDFGCIKSLVSFQHQSFAGARLSPQSMASKRVEAERIGGKIVSNLQPNQTPDDLGDYLPILGDGSLAIYRHSDGDPAGDLFVVSHKDAPHPVLELRREKQVHILDVAMEIRDHEAIVGYIQAYQSSE